MLILVCGLPATGKSTFANNLAKKIDAAVLRTDVIRKELLERPRYSEEEKELVYKVTFLLAKYLLRANQNVIIDGTFYKKRLRQRVYNLAKETFSRLHIIECICPERVIRARMRRRPRNIYEPSDADFDIYKKIKEQYEPIKREHIVIDTSKSFNQNIKKALKEMGL